MLPIYSNQPFGINETALIWANIISLVLLAGPACVALVYLMIRDRASGRMAKQPPEQPFDEQEFEQNHAA